VIEWRISTNEIIDFDEIGCEEVDSIRPDERISPRLGEQAAVLLLDFTEYKHGNIKGDLFFLLQLLAFVSPAASGRVTV
jgi:hypothetical protein